MAAKKKKSKIDVYTKPSSGRSLPVQNCFVSSPGISLNVAWPGWRVQPCWRVLLSVADSLGKEECLEGRSELLFLVFIVGLLCLLHPYINCGGLSAALRRTYLQGSVAPGWELGKQISQATLVSWSLTLFSFATSKFFNVPSGPIKGQFIRKGETNLILWGIWMHLLIVFVKCRPPVRLERKCD